MGVNYNQDMVASKEFIGMKQDFISKNPSTATASNLQGRAPGGAFIPGVTSGRGFGMGQIVNDSFDLDIMMPPDINSIDSDISKITIYWLVQINWERWLQPPWIII